MGLTPADPRFIAWYGLMQACLRSLDHIERDVEAATGLPLSWFEVLVRLHKEPDGRRRMGELADTVLLSRGGATRLVARMERAGLVRRETPPDDRRATFAVLTERGRAAVEAAAPLQAAAIERHFGRAIGEDDAELLRRLAVRVLETIGDPCPWLVEDLAGPGACAPDGEPAAAAAHDAPAQR